MDTSDPEITFDEKGYCNHCTNYFENLKQKTYRGLISDNDLKSLVEEIKSKGKKSKYDCLIGVSGGVDSSYVAYCAKRFGLRALCVHMDNGWNSEISVQNIKKLVETLGFDYESYVLDWEEFKDLQLSFLKASVPEIETPTDIAILAALHKIASTNNIKYIFSGGNFVTEGILPKSWHYDAKDSKYIKSIHKIFGTKKLKKFPFFSFIKEFYYKFFRGIKMIYFLNYVQYSKQEAMKILENELGWKYYGGKHYESKYTGFVQSYILPVKFNIDYRKATLSSQICAGELSREIAIEELKKSPFNIENVKSEKDYLAKKLGISITEFENILKLPPKTHRDYPNNEKLLNYIYTTYKKIKG